MTTHRNVFLIGPMGAGKSSIGRLIARTLEMEFVDADRELETRTGARIQLIFDVEGEAGFREREARLLEELTARRGLVLATGGGAVLDEENRRRLRSRGLVIYLRAPLERLIARTRRDRSRPLLQTEDPAARLAAIVAEREPLYRQTADLIVDTDERTVRDIVKGICRDIKELCER